jgi:hypothetical protein
MEVSTQRPAEPAAAKPAAAPAQEKMLPPLDYAFQSLLLPIKKSLARIEAKLAENGAAKSTVTPIEPIPVAGDTSISVVTARIEQLSADLAEFRRAALHAIENNPAPFVVAEEIKPLAIESPTEAVPLEPAIHDSWEEIILGPELSGNAKLNTVREQFLSDVVSGVTSARALAGQLLLLQTTPPDELPERFRHVGEAYYRWRPRTTTADDPLEQALADWLTRQADAAGLRNSIQLVRPGDRFDSTRHSATTRGVEVTAVHGWVVLRDGAKVYTKASVTVQ